MSHASSFGWRRADLQRRVLTASHLQRRARLGGGTVVALPRVMEVSTWLWGVFAAVVVASLTFDLVGHRASRGDSARAALAWSGVWIALALAFAVLVGVELGGAQAEDFLTAYLMEKALSIDNVFVFLLVFGRLRMKRSEQHRVLFWGILGALVLRGVFIAAGASVISRWHEVVYVLGAILIYTGVHTARKPAGEVQADSRILRFLRDRLHLRSPFVLALVTIELTDIMFAVDSVPAVFAITDEPFIVYTSNVFAMLGLRALYLVLAGLLGKLRYLHYALAAILVLAGVKMVTSSLWHVPHVVSLLAIVAILAVAIVASVRANRRW